MPNGITITNVPEASDPSALADWAGLITSITGLMVAIGWPVVVIVGMVLFRKSIRSFIGRIKNAKGLGLDLETQLESIATQAEAVEAQAELAAPAEPIVPAVGADAPVVEPRPIDLGPPPFGDQKRWNKSNRTFQQLVRQNPGAALLFTASELESALQRLAKALDVPVTLPRFMIGHLQEIGAIGPMLATLLLDLENVRTKVAHGFTEASETDARQFRTSAKTVEKELSELTQNVYRDRTDSTN